MRNDQREILYYDIKFHSSSERVAMNIEIDDVVTLMEAEVAGGRNSLKINNDDNTLIIRDIKRIAGHAVFFIAVTDKRGPNAVYTHENTLKAREIKKAPGEANELGTHLFVKLVKGPLENTAVPAYIEHVVGLSPTYVQRIFNASINGNHKESEEGAFSGPNKTGKKGPDIRYRPIANFLGVPSTAFQKAIDTGNLLAIKMIKMVPAQSFGGRLYLKPKEKTLQVKIDRVKLPKKDLLNELRAAFKKEAADWPVAHLRFELPDGTSGSVDMQTDSGVLEGTHYIKRVNVIGINPELANSADGVVEHFAKAALAKV